MKCPNSSITTSPGQHVYDDAHRQELRLPPTVHAAFSARQAIMGIVARTRDDLQYCEHPEGKAAVQAIMQELEQVAAGLSDTASAIINEQNTRGFLS